MGGNSKNERWGTCIYIMRGLSGSYQAETFFFPVTFQVSFFSHY